MGWTVVALNKISIMAKREGFHGFTGIEEDKVYMRFGDRIATVDKFGKVIWSDL